MSRNNNDINLGSHVGISSPLDCALIVISCDSYSDLWPPFFSLLAQYWPDCPFPTYLGTESLSWKDASVHPLSSKSPARDWSSCLISYLHQLTETYVLIMLDDFFIRKPVSNNRILECLDFAKSSSAIRVALIPFPSPTDSVPETSWIGECAPGLPYRLNTQAAIWERSKLIELIVPGESIWEFEQRGTERALASDHGFYSVKKAILPYKGFLTHHVVQRGKWFPHQKWLFARREIGCDFGRRESLSWIKTLFYHGTRLMDNLLSILPWRIKAALKRKFKKRFGLFRKKHS